MQTTIDAYDPDTRQVRATFVEGDVTHTRQVNACHDQDGDYDPEATAQRVADVARGVATKIALGVIAVAPPQPETLVEQD